jgi:hypothetical protein
VRTRFGHQTGSMDYLRRQHGLDAGSLAAAAEQVTVRKAA